MVFTTTTKFFNKNKQFVCLAVRQSLRNLFDLVEKHNDLKREEYNAINQQQKESLSTNQVIVPGYIEINPKHNLMNNVMNYSIYKDLSVITMFIFTAKRVILWMYEIFY